MADALSLLSPRTLQGPAQHRTIVPAFDALPGAGKAGSGGNVLGYVPAGFVASTRHIGLFGGI